LRMQAYSQYQNDRAEQEYTRYNNETITMLGIRAYTYKKIYINEKP